jgi:ankyrin repeat protein
MMKSFAKAIVLMVCLCSIMACQSPGNSTRIAMSDAEFLELCITESSEDIQEAIQNGANVNARDGENGPTALMIAANRNSDPNAITVLLKAGADPGVKDDDGQSLQDYFRYNSVLPEDPDVYWGLNNTIIAISNESLKPYRTGSLKEVQAAIQCKNEDEDKCDKADRYGRTPLMWAAGHLMPSWRCSKPRRMSTPGTKMAGRL